MTTTIYDLPNELLTEVISFLSTPDLLAVCRTSKNLKVLATCLIYRVISPNTPVQAIRCFQTIITQPQAALAVRRFEVTFYSSRLNLLTSFFQLTATAIRHCALSIKFLDLDVLTPIFLYLNRTTTTLPHLVECILPYSPHPLAFLARHTRTIASLHFLSDACHSATFNAGLRLTSMVRTHLPCLKELACNSACIASLIPPFTLVESATVSWRDGESESKDGDEEYLNHLLSSPALHSMVIITSRRDNTSLMRAFAFAAHSANTSILTTLGFRVVDGAAFVEGLATSLGALQALVHLSVRTTSQSAPHSVSFDDVDKELEYVTRWGEVCPMLRIGIFPSSIVWGRVAVGCWIPVDGLADDAEWRERAIATGKYAFLDAAKSPV